MTPSRLVTAASTAAACVVGTVAMDLLWYSRARSGGSHARFTEWEFSDAESFEDVRNAAAALGVGLPDSSAGITNDVVHWMTGPS